MKTQLVIMAAGIGSRFGAGIKQLARVGANGEAIIEYSIYDAIKAGFDEVVFIIRKDIEEEFKNIIGNKISSAVSVKYVYQELDKLPQGFAAPSDRTKPWGTAHAIYCAKGAIDSPFAVINADDYYGKEGFKKIHDYLVTTKLVENGKLNSCMAGFIISNTLSDNGTVTRGVCKLDENKNIKSVTETYEIKLVSDGGQSKIMGQDDNKADVEIDKSSLVSMNMWGLPKEFLDGLETEFKKFLEKNINNVKSEFLLPSYINDMIKQGTLSVACLPVNDKWFGVTYAEDKDKVINEFKKLSENKVYPDKLF